MSHRIVLPAPVEDASPTGGRRRTTWVVLSGLALLFVGWLLFFLLSSGGTPPGIPSAAGDGAAAIGDGGSIVVNQTTVVTGLAPGKPAADLRGTFDVPGADPVYIDSVTASVAGTTRPGCSPEDFVIQGSPAKVGTRVDAGRGKGSWAGITIRLENRAVNQDACKNARVLISYSAQ